MFRIAIIVIAIALASAPVSFAGPSTSTSEPATSQSNIAGRDTPAGAMNAFEQAVNSGDLATVADSFNIASEPARQSIARELVLEARFDKAVDARFGHAALVSLCNECRMKPTSSDVKYTNDMWTISPQRPDQAAGETETGPNWREHFLHATRAGPNLADGKVCVTRGPPNCDVAGSGGACATRTDDAAAKPANGSS